LPADALSAVARANWSETQWTALLRVEVAGDEAGSKPAVAGRYLVRDGKVLFAPLFGFDAGVKYRATFDPAALPSGTAWTDAAPVVEVVGRPRGDQTPTTRVTALYPSGDEAPENLLRMYIQFSAPMGRQGGLGFVHLLDDQGREVEAAFLPLEAELWNGDHTRFTVFLDPGRVKRGILPNEMMGRALAQGRRYTLAVDREWLDAKGLPLTETFRKSFQAGAADSRPLDPATWRITPPHAATREPLTVTFPEPLDRGLMLRALGVRLNGAALDGDPLVAAGERTWSFVPATAWAAGSYQFIALAILEDPAGNRVGRAFEVDEFDRTDPVSRADADTVSLPFSIAKR
jgi:hypothetical protein